MDETRQLKITRTNRSFFNKAIFSLSRLFVIPTQKGMYGIYISFKRKEILKSFKLLNKISPQEASKEEELTNRYEKAYEEYMRNNR